MNDLALINRLRPEYKKIVTNNIQNSPETYALLSESLQNKNDIGQLSIYEEILLVEAAEIFEIIYNSETIKQLFI